MFRPKWPSSGVQFVVFQDPAAHCNPILVLMLLLPLVLVMWVVRSGFSVLCYELCYSFLEVYLYEYIQLLYIWCCLLRRRYILVQCNRMLKYNIMNISRLFLHLWSIKFFKHSFKIHCSCIQLWSGGKKVKISLFQAVEAYRVARG
jgi:hypothetical protein